MIRYAPWAEPRLARKPGTQPLDMANWLEPDDRAETQLAYRQRLISDRRAEVLAEIAGSEAAQAELYDLLCAHTGRDGPDNAFRDDPSPLARIGVMVQEDFCLLEQAEAGAEYVLTAAILCFPSRWSLAEKIGKPLIGIHAPVPDYTDDVARRVARLFEAIRPEAPLWRANWTLHPTEELFLPPVEVSRSKDTHGSYFVRVERQSFVRLPRSRAVVFGIKTYIDPIESLTKDKACSLINAIDQQDAAEIDYRGGAAFYADVRKALAGLAEQP